MRNKIFAIVITGMILLAGSACAESESMKVVDYVLTHGQISQTSKTIMETVKVDLQNGQNEKALTDLDTLIKLKPDAYGPVSLYALICIENGWWERAIEPAKKMVALKPNDIAAHESLATAYAKIGNKPEAEKEYAIVEKMRKAREAKND